MPSLIQMVEYRLVSDDQDSAPVTFRMESRYQHEAIKNRVWEFRPLLNPGRSYRVQRNNGILGWEDIGLSILTVPSKSNQDVADRSPGHDGAARNTESAA